MTAFKNRAQHDKVATTTLAYTTHIVDVDLSALLAQYGIEDHVILTIQTPSGRAKRVTLNPSFLIPPHHVGEDDWDNRL